MNNTENEIMEFIEDNNVKFIRLAICDIYGTQKNISIMPTELMRAFDVGIPFDASAIDGFGDAGQPDLFLFPDPSTIALLPWRPTHGRVARLFCNIKHPDGTPFELDSRYILKQAVDKAKKAGISCKICAECEFYLFKNDEENNPTNIPFDNAGYMDIAPEDKGENVRREICLTLEEMGITPESSHHEEGPGQNEIDFRYGDPMLSADDIITFRMVVKTIAARNNLHASFNPKPIPDNCGNGFHINLSPLRSGGVYDSKLTEQFMAGIMARIAEMTLFLNPTEESYIRLGSYKAPKYISWSEQNRTQLMRIPPADGKHRRIEVRSPDSMANPYIAIALLIYAGLEGLEKQLVLDKPINLNLYKASEEFLSTLKKLPDTIDEALLFAEQSEFIKSLLPQRLLDAYKDRVKAGK